MRPLYIFDLDGTLALIEHRLHFIQQKPKDWRSFFAAVKDDTPNLPVIRTLQALRKSGAEVWIWSGLSIALNVGLHVWLCVGGNEGRSRWWRLLTALQSVVLSTCVFAAGFAVGRG